MDALKAIDRIVSKKGMLQLDLEDFGHIDSLVYYLQHEYIVESKELKPELKINIQKNLSIVVNITSSPKITLFEIEDILSTIRKCFYHDVDVTYGHIYEDDTSKILIDLFVYKKGIKSN